jgi:hypothetical protein
MKTKGEVLSLAVVGERNKCFQNCHTNDSAKPIKLKPLQTAEKKSNSRQKHIKKFHYTVVIEN